MYMGHIYICSSTQAATSKHTERFDKCLTPKAGEGLWGQALVEPLGVHAVVPRPVHVYVLACTNVQIEKFIQCTVCV